MLDVLLGAIASLGSSEVQNLLSSAGECVIKKRTIKAKRW